MIRGFLNGETRLDKLQSLHGESIVYVKGTQGTEPSKYLEEEKVKQRLP